MIRKNFSSKRRKIIETENSFSAISKEEEEEKKSFNNIQMISKRVSPSSVCLFETNFGMKRKFVEQFFLSLSFY